MTGSNIHLIKMLDNNKSERQILFPHLAKESETMFVVLDQELKIVQINDSAAKAAASIVGSSPKPGDLIVDYILPRFVPLLKRDIQRCLKGEVIKRFNKIGTGAEEHIFSYRLLSLDLHPKKLVTLEAVRMPSSEMMPVAIEEQKSYLSNIFNTISTGIKISDAKGKIITVNKAYQEMTGLSEEDFQGKTILHTLPEDEKEMAIEQLADFVLKDIPPKRNWRMLHKDGHEMSIDLAISKVRVGGEYKIIYSITDLSKQKGLEQNLENAKAQMDALVNNLSLMLWSVDENLCFVTANKAAKDYFKRYLGYDFVPGDLLTQVFDATDVPRAEKRKQRYLEVLRTKKTQSFEAVESFRGALQHLSGEMHPILEGNQVRGISCFMEDDTKAFLRSTFSKGLGNFIVHCAKASSIKQVLTHLVEDVLTKLFIEEGEVLLLKEGKLKPIVRYKEGKVKKRLLKSETFVVKPGEGVTGKVAQSGKTLIVADSATDPRVLNIEKAFASEIAVPLKVREEVFAVINCESQSKGFFGEIYREILEAAAREAGEQIRKLQDAATIQEMELHYKTILTSTPNSILLIGKDQQILAYNKRAGTDLPQYGGQKELKPGMSYIHFVREEDREAFNAAVSRALEGRVFVGEREIYHPLAGKVWVQVTFAPAYNKLEEIFGVTLIIKNITKAKHSEKLILDQNYALKKANRELDNFVYSISHDVRAPLSSIQGLSGLIEMAKTLDESLEYNHFIKESAEKLDHLIHNILDYSRNKRKQNQPEKINPRGLVRQVLDSNRYHEGFPGIDFQLDLPSTPIFFDPFRIRLILDNAISNAIKYHDPKKKKRWVKIKMENVEKEFHIIVEDNGQGIKEELQKKVFDMFVTANRQSKGNGIGMYIMRETVNFLEGNINVSSKFGAGTKIHITLPTPKAHAHIADR